MDNRIFEEKNIDISEVNSEEELIEMLNEIKVENEKFYKIILNGTSKIEINKNRICKLIKTENVLKLKNKTETECDFDKLAKQKSLKGIFIKRMLEKLKNNPEQEETIKKAIDIGLKSFE